MMTALVIDAGTPRFLGILSVSDGKYTWYRGESIREGVARIYASDQVITFNGDRYDLAERGGFPELQNLPPTVAHVDMMAQCWQADQEFFGKGLRQIYVLLFGGVPAFPDTYEGDNERDCYMTLKLFELWKAGRLRAP
jgi:hypothetical protein